MRAELHDPRHLAIAAGMEGRAVISSRDNTLEYLHAMVSICRFATLQRQTDVLVMTGRLIDAYLLRKHTASFDRMLTTFLAKHPGTPKELKTKVFINGSGGWSRLATRRGSSISLLGGAAMVAGPSRPTNFGRAALARDPERGRFRFCGWQLDSKTRRLTDPTGAPVTLTKGEYALLIAFLDALQRPLSREHLLQATRVHEDVFDRSIDVQILRLRPIVR